MGLFGALFTGVSGLNAESQATSMIADNIANTNTVGFKRSEAAFSSLVTTESRLADYSSGTVSVNRLQRIDEQGALQSTSSATDSAISGSGFFAVKRLADDLQEFLYTRNGSFSEDQNGILKNSAGFFLYAWPVDADGNLPANQGDLSSLVPADVAFLGGLTRPTTSAELAINLDATEANIATVNIPTADGAGGFSLPLALDQGADFTRGLTVFDSLGSEQNLTVQFRKITGPMANVTSRNSIGLDPTDSIVDSLNNINATDAIDIVMGGATLRLEFLANEGDATSVAGGAGITVQGAYTAQDMLDTITDFTFGATDGLEARLNSTGQVVIQASNVTDTFTIDDFAGTPASGNATTFDFGDDTAGSFPLEANATDYETAMSGNNGTIFPSLNNESTPNTQGWWEMKVLKSNGSVLTEGLMNFDSDGQLNAAEDGSGNIDIQLSDIDWGNGSSPQDINIDISRFSQFAGNYDVIASDQNGAELGLRTGVEITREGEIVARFSNGATTTLYKIPLTTFSNPNGLNGESGTSFAETTESGEENLREAGAGGAGIFQPSAVEGSNVDLASEFSRLIVSQRTFSANSRLVSTIDEMTQDLLRLR